MVNIPRNPPQGNIAKSTVAPTVTRTTGKHQITVPPRDRVLSTTVPSVRINRRRFPPKAPDLILTTYAPIITGGRKLFTAGEKVASAPGVGVITLGGRIEDSERPTFSEDGIPYGLISYVAMDVAVEVYEFATGLYAKSGGVETITRVTLDRSTTGFWSNLSADTVVYISPDHYATPLAVSLAVPTVIDGGTF